VPQPATQHQAPFTILFPDSRAEHQDIEREVVGPDTVLLNPRKTSFEAIDRKAWETCDAIIVSRVPINSQVVPHLHRARIVVRGGVGFDTVDLKACGEAGIAVCNVPDYGTTDVADSAIALMLTFARGTATFDTELRADLKAGWNYLRNPTSRRLRGLCFGVIGLGRIGTAAALRASTFGMNVAFFDPYRPNGTELSYGYQRARTLEELLGIADVISLHAPLSSETRGMIDAVAVSAMKPGAWFINTARGAICDSAALRDGVKSGRIAALGIDALPQEPATLEDPLVAAWQANEPWLRGRMLLNPHAAHYSPASALDMRRKAIETAYGYLKDGTLINCVNEAVLKNRR
jgi:phosphoglycerate dehydrogenase-like enzyme